MLFRSNNRSGPMPGIDDKQSVITPPVQRRERNGVAMTLARGDISENCENRLTLTGKVKKVAVSVIQRGLIMQSSFCLRLINDVASGINKTIPRVANKDKVNETESATLGSNPINNTTTIPKEDNAEERRISNGAPAESKLITTARKHEIGNPVMTK